MPSKTLHNTHNCQCIILLLMIIRLNQPVSSDTCYHAQDKINGLENRHSIYKVQVSSNVEIQL